WGRTRPHARPSLRMKLRPAGRIRTTTLKRPAGYGLLITHDGGSHEGKESPPIPCPRLARQAT
ncbi:MAG: hypothetical protein O2901_12765, partial [Verrucomicrobia bacterium]|nr:hypothetical protein [Verrucomicrobiota bacterium]